MLRLGIALAMLVAATAPASLAGAAVASDHLAQTVLQGAQFHTENARGRSVCEHASATVTMTARQDTGYDFTVASVGDRADPGNAGCGLNTLTIQVPTDLWASALSTGQPAWFAGPSAGCSYVSLLIEPPAASPIPSVRGAPPPPPALHFEASYHSPCGDRVTHNVYVWSALVVK